MTIAPAPAIAPAAASAPAAEPSPRLMPGSHYFLLALVATALFFVILWITGGGGQRGTVALLAVLIGLGYGAIRASGLYFTIIALAHIPAMRARLATGNAHGVPPSPLHQNAAAFLARFERAGLTTLALSHRPTLAHILLTLLCFIVPAVVLTAAWPDIAGHLGRPAPAGCAVPPGPPPSLSL
ncbi:MAG: hypothetical protein IT557_15050 [Alphaproteobacteria bacterium]|nr:hypothetical protein [Alphaproteobacteria bacterium]